MSFWRERFKCFDKINKHKHLHIEYISYIFYLTQFGKHTYYRREVIVFEMLSFNKKNAIYAIVNVD